MAKVPGTLRNISAYLARDQEAKWEFTDHMFRFVAVAFVRFGTRLALDYKAGRIPKFHEDWRLEDPVDAVLSTCSSWLVDSGDDFGKVTQILSYFGERIFDVHPSCSGSNTE